MDSFPSTSGSEQPQQHGIDDFDPHTGSFLGALQFMLQLFNDGVDAEEITILFRNHNRPMQVSFVQQVVGGHVPTGPPDDDTQQKRINLDMKIFAVIIQMDRAGISVSVIQARIIAELGYFVRERFIREIVCEREIWDGY